MMIRQKTNDAPKESNDLSNVTLDIEYTALRSEILKRIELRQQLLSITLTIAAAFLGVGLTTAMVSLIYPPLAAFLALAWSQNDFRIRQLAIYIRDKYESSTTGLGWETYMQEQRGQTRLGAWRVVILSHGGIFLLTQLMAIIIGLFKFTSAPLEWVLLGIDALAILLVLWLLWRSR